MTELHGKLAMYEKHIMNTLGNDFRYTRHQVVEWTHLAMISVTLGTKLFDDFLD